MTRYHAAAAIPPQESSDLRRGFLVEAEEAHSPITHPEAPGSLEALQVFRGKMQKAIQEASKKARGDNWDTLNGRGGVQDTLESRITELERCLRNGAPLVDTFSARQALAGFISEEFPKLFVKVRRNKKNKLSPYLAALQVHLAHAWHEVDGALESEGIPVEVPSVVHRVHAKILDLYHPILPSKMEGDTVPPADPEVKNTQALGNFCRRVEAAAELLRMENESLKQRWASARSSEDPRMPIDPTLKDQTLSGQEHKAEELARILDQARQLQRELEVPLSLEDIDVLQDLLLASTCYLREHEPPGAWADFENQDLGNPTFSTEAIAYRAVAATIISDLIPLAQMLPLAHRPTLIFPNSIPEAYAENFLRSMDADPHGTLTLGPRDLDRVHLNRRQVLEARVRSTGETQGQAEEKTDPDFFRASAPSEADTGTDPAETLQPETVELSEPFYLPPAPIAALPEKRPHLELVTPSKTVSPERNIVLAGTTLCATSVAAVLATLALKAEPPQPLPQASKVTVASLQMTGVEVSTTPAPEKPSIQTVKWTEKNEGATWCRANPHMAGWAYDSGGKGYIVCP